MAASSPTTAKGPIDKVPAMKFGRDNTGKDYDTWERWLRWEKRVQKILDEHFGDKTDKQKCSFIMLVIGDGGRAVYNKWNLTEEEKENSTVKNLFNRFEDFCIPRNVVGIRFMQRKQREGETVDEYVNELRRLVRGCEYGMPPEERIIDQLISGTNNPRITQALLDLGCYDIDRVMPVAREVERSTQNLQNVVALEEWLGNVE